MLNFFLFPFLCFCFTVTQFILFAESDQQELASFTPPAGWREADLSKISLPPLVKVMIIGKSSSNYPPSINLACEPYHGSLKDYLQIVKLKNSQKNICWKDLGNIRTKAGNASLSQVDLKSDWGDIRQMHTICLKNGVIYILTASALKSEFSLYYRDFFNAMSSFEVSSSLSQGG